MATEWFYTRGGQQQGPISTEELQSMINTGKVGNADLVWNESLPSWVPPSGAPGLSPAPSSATAAPAQSPFGSPYPASVLPYSAPTGEGVVATPLALEMLRQTKPWARLFSVILFVIGGILLLVGAIVVIAGIATPRQNGAYLMGMGCGYMIFPLLYLMPAIYLGRYATNIGTLLQMGRSTDLEAVLSAQKSFWKFVGIVTLVIICFYVLMFGLFIVALGARF